MKVHSLIKIYSWKISSITHRLTVRFNVKLRTFEGFEAIYLPWYCAWGLPRVGHPDVRCGVALLISLSVEIDFFNSIVWVFSPRCRGRHLCSDRPHYSRWSGPIRIYNVLTSERKRQFRKWRWSHLQRNPRLNFLPNENKRHSRSHSGAVGCVLLLHNKHFIEWSQKKKTKYEFPLMKSLSIFIVQNIQKIDLELIFILFQYQFFRLRCDGSKQTIPRQPRHKAFQIWKRT